MMMPERNRYTGRFKAKKKRVCTWREDEDGNWTTACGDMFTFIDGTPEENKMRFCCYCGKPLKEVKYREANDA